MPRARKLCAPWLLGACQLNAQRWVAAWFELGSSIVPALHGPLSTLTSTPLRYEVGSPTVPPMISVWPGWTYCGPLAAAFGRSLSIVMSNTSALLIGVMRLVVGGPS